MAGEEALGACSLRARRQPPDGRDPRRLQRIAVAGRGGEEQRGAAVGCRLRVCQASLETKTIGRPAMSLAGLTSEA
jgi:hypothetical protein